MEHMTQTPFLFSEDTATWFLSVSIIFTFAPKTKRFLCSQVTGPRLAETDTTLNDFVQSLEENIVCPMEEKCLC